MSIQNKKQIYLITLAFLVCAAVYFLFPSGNELLLTVRRLTSNDEIPHGKEIMYSFVDKGDIKVADEILNNEYELSRFAPVKIDHITWNEDPYSDIYWRFNFYNLEPVRNLLYAWDKTGNPAYKDKLIEITTSYIDTGMNEQYSWDLHGAAFRTMTLIDVWWKLHNKNQLPEEFSQKILNALEVHGNYLADPDHFEKDYNHGLDQSAALYLLCINFPKMQNANSWLPLATERINGLLVGIVDEDGVLIENSPYYHFYVLEKLWEINAYQKDYDLPAFTDLSGKIDKMIAYGAHILQPDLNVPTIGASLKGEIKLAGVYMEMAKTHPDLLYVLTKGKQGIAPKDLNIHYTSGGETIMRSAWGKGEDFVKQTQLIFDVGSYRTNHSDLDALSFNLYSQGIALMPDAGLYSYDPGPYRSYFHGTRAHNTVVVDGKDQKTDEVTNGGVAKVFSGAFKEGDGYVYQSGESELYDGVSHTRAIAMIEDSTVLIFDDLTSSSDHTYEQMFHLFPGARISTDGLTVTATGTTSPEQKLTIRQFISDGIELHSVINQQEPLDGICSFEYKVAAPCYSISYAQKAQHASYVTAISIGTDPAAVTYDKDSGIVTVTTKKGIYHVTTHKTDGVPENIEVNKNFDISQIYSIAKSAYSLNLLGAWRRVEESDPENVPILDGGSVAVNYVQNALEIKTPYNGSNLHAQTQANLDLSNQNIYFKIKVTKSLSLRSFDIHLSNNNWEKDAVFYAHGSTYDVNRDGEWLQFGVGKGELRASDLGGWIKDPGFDWSKVDGVKFTLSSKPGESATVDIKDFTLVPDQKKGQVVIMFDDGETSIMDVLPIMSKYGFRGDVGVITGSVGWKSYMTLDDLKLLQDQYHWDILNHTNLHKDAVEEYVDKNDLADYETDVTDGLQYLIRNGINTVPNWFVYPHGSTDGPIKDVIAKYYKFARATDAEPAIYPFAEPLEIGMFPVYSDRATTQDVHYAIKDAIKYDQTIMLVFHKFTAGTPTVYTEWQLSKFEDILKDIQQQGIKVVTLSDLDKENNIPETQFTLHDFIPPQFNIDITVAQNKSGPLRFIQWIFTRRQLF